MSGLKEEPAGLSRSEHLSLCDDLIEAETVTLPEFQFLRMEVCRLEGRVWALRRLVCGVYCIPPSHHLECLRTLEMMEVEP